MGDTDYDNIYMTIGTGPIIYQILEMENLSVKIIYHSLLFKITDYAWVSLVG